MGRNPKDKSADTTVVGVLEIKLSACLTAPMASFLKDMDTVALECNRIRNGMVRAWQRWHEDNPWTPEPVIVKKTGKPFMWRGRVCPKNELLPADQTTMLYHAGRTASRMVAAKIVAALANEVQDYLKGLNPYNHPGKTRYRWQAILEHEVSAPSYREISIPVQVQDSILSYDGYAFSGNPITDKARAELMVDKGCSVLKFALFSKEFGREKCYHVCRINAGQLTAGNRRVLRNVASGRWKLCDSKLVFKEGRRPGTGYWSFQMVYRQPVKASGLNPARMALVMPSDGQSPFTVELVGDSANGSAFRPWQLGETRVLLEQYKRIDNRRRVLRSDYRTAGTGVKGHGQERFYRDLRKPTRQGRNLMNLFVKRTVSQIIAFCERFDCGSVRYDEPGVIQRRGSWFEANKVPFDWTIFRSQLEHQCKLNGIAMVEDAKAKKVV